MKLETIMTTEVVTVGTDDSLHTVQALFERFRFHHLLVLNEEGKLVGVVSDRDLLKALSPFISTLMERNQDLRTLERRVHQIMARKPITASKDLAISKAAILMLTKRVSCLPIVHPDRTVEGIVTHKDILSWLIEQADWRGDA